MAKLSHLGGPNRFLHGNINLSRAVVAIGTVKSGINTTNAIISVIDGIMRSVAALVSQALVTGGDAFRVQPQNTTVYYVFAVNAAGLVRTFQGRYLGEPFTSPTGLSLVGDGAVPDIPDGWAPFGMAKVATAAATTFTPNTTLFDAAGVTTTFYDLMCLPAADRP